MVGVSELDIVKGLLRVLQREVHDMRTETSADLHLLVEQGRLIRDRVGHLETRLALVTESSYASYERPKPTHDVTIVLERIEAALQRLEGTKP